LPVDDVEVAVAVDVAERESVVHRAGAVVADAPGRVHVREAPAPVPRKTFR
jgi:hypothetical protein